MFESSSLFDRFFLALGALLPSVLALPKVGMLALLAPLDELALVPKEKFGALVASVGATEGLVALLPNAKLVVAASDFVEAPAKLPPNDTGGAP